MKKPSTFRQKHDAQLANTEIQFTPLDPWVGALCIEFNNLEFVLSLLLQRLLGADTTGMTAVWVSQMWSTRLRLMETLFEARVPDANSPYRDYFRRLKPSLVDIAATRNAVVHGMRSTHTDLDGTITHAIIPNDFGMDPWVPRRKFAIDESEFREVILDIRLAVDRVSLLMQHLDGQLPDPEVLRVTEVRRRPPVRKSP